MSNDISLIRKTLGLTEKKVAVPGNANIRWPNACIACGATGDLQKPNTKRPDLEGAGICPACFAKQNNLDLVTFFGFPLFLIIGTIGLQYFWFSGRIDSSLWSWGISCVFGFLLAAVVWLLWYLFSSAKTLLPKKEGAWTSHTVYRFSTEEAAKQYQIANGEDSIRGVRRKKRKDQRDTKGTLMPLVLLAIPFAIAYLFGRYILLGWLGFSHVSEVISAMTACWFGLMVTVGIMWAFSGFPLPSNAVNSMTLKTDWGFVGAFVLIVLLVVGVPILGGYWVDRLFLAHRDGAWQRNIGSVCEETTVSPDPIISPLGKVWIPYALGGPSLRPRDIGLDEARSVEEIDTVVCISNDLVTVERCSYGEGARVLKRFQSIWEIKVVDLVFCLKWKWNFAPLT